MFGSDRFNALCVFVRSRGELDSVKFGLFNAKYTKLSGLTGDGDGELETVNLFYNKLVYRTHQLAKINSQ